MDIMRVRKTESPSSKWMYCSSICSMIYESRIPRGQNCSMLLRRFTYTWYKYMVARRYIVNTINQEYSVLSYFHITIPNKEPCTFFWFVK